MKNIATSSYDFKSIIDNGAVYVDKTKYIYELVKDEVNARYFIARPRRFGKSLLLSTLSALFQGEKEYFNGLDIERTEYDFAKRYPIVHLDLTTALAESVADVESALRAMVAACAEPYGVRLEKEFASSASVMLAALIRQLAAGSDSGKVVVLVDEYDAPVTRFIDNPAECDAVRAKMHDFYVQLKVCDSKIRFLFMTGVSKFAKLSVFSGLNNLVDLTLDAKFAGMLGYTHDDIDKFLREHVGAYAGKTGKTYDDAKAQLIEWYDGYRFSPDSDVRVCNPVSLGSALKDGAVKSDPKAYTAKNDDGVPGPIIEGGGEL